MQPTVSQPLFRPAAFRHGDLGDVGQTVVKDKNDDDDKTRDFLVSIAQASLPQPLLPPQSGNAWRVYPTVPFYATMQGLQLLINVAGPAEDAGDDMNDAALLKSLPALQSLVQDAATKYGGVFYLGALQATCNKLLYPGSAATTTTTTTTTTTPTAELDYWRYLQALHDVFRRFVELRDLCCRAPSLEFCTHHVFFVRVADHPRLKDIVALLAIENARLCFCLSASSRVTQQYFTQHARDVGVELEWVLGSAMVSEPERLAVTDVNPVFALWDVFVSLPLHTTSFRPSLPAGASDGAAAAFSFDGVVAERFLRNVNLTLLSSLRFAGSEWIAPALRLCEVGQLAEGGRSRVLWSLVGTPRLVLPHLVAGLVRCLVEESPVDCFELRFAHGTAAAGETGGRDEIGPRGLAYVTGAQRGVVQRKTASSTSNNNFRAFTRLSAESWLSDDDRRRYALFMEDDPVPLECEFVVDSLCYSRRMMGQDRLATDGELLHPQRWGCCFRVKNHVEHILFEDED